MIDTKCECGCHLSDGMYNHDATEPCPSCHNTANEKAREIAAQCWCKPTTKNKVMDVELCEVFAAALREYGETESAKYRNILLKIKAEVADRDYGDWGNRLHAFLKEAGL